ncbi:cache domain-containing sensor histidine kinase [Paenibacillus sp. JDR-2]|uniref:cache domain-containing sensor histidine kinase n=1 Tax=Paenibacillus sp. (strain JDR-2) TaxID=324057 RepID=UPI0001666C79|nr:sensor histidine kinase [Paenibacillus sp. JDR-2]ACT01213.1 putative sensor with HAMP domain [Paenibacillus sp. JDR-2]
MKMRKKLLLSYLLVVLIPIIVLGYYLISSLTSVTLQNNDRINKIGLQQIGANISDEITNIMKFSDRIMLDRSLTNYLDTEYRGLEATEEEFVQYQKDYSTIFDTYSSGLTILNNKTEMVLFSDNPSTIKDRTFLLELTDDLKREDWSQELMKARGDNVFLGLKKDAQNNRQEIVIGRQLASVTNYTHLLQLSVAESTLYKYIQMETGNKEIYLLDAQGRVMTANANRDYIGQAFDQIPGIAPLLNNAKNDGPTVVSLPLELRSPFSGWKLVAIFSSGSVLSNIGDIVRQSLLVCLVCVLISLLMMMIFSERLSRRLKQLVRHMANIRDGRMAAPEPDHTGDEIGELNRGFRNMIHRINELISEVYQQDIERKQLIIEKQDAELRALQSQINPHFLFNTMESIRMTLVKKRDTETADIVASFSKLFRQSMDWRSEWNTIAQEADFISHYIRVLKLRFRDKLQFKMQIDEDAQQLELPKFTLQPLIENAIVHSIERRIEGGCISLKVQMAGERIRIAICDDSPGFSPERLIEITDRLAQSASVKTSERIGLLNVHLRLVAVFGQEAGLRIESEPGRTVFSFEIQANRLKLQA